MSIAYLDNIVHFAGLAKKVHYLNSFGFSRNPLFDLIGINVESVDVNIREDGLRTGEEGDVGRSYEAERGCDNLIAFTYPSRKESNVESSGAAVSGNRVFCSDVLREGFLKFLDPRTLSKEP